ncbi:hypothetical protein [Actinacidiphila sp. bgisy167]|uniref:hypothetical protein n=1 Tax=Actinacidiphila sp. bgisy167 TaxID=3413797 RepID=UPI003D762EF1
MAPSTLSPSHSLAIEVLACAAAAAVGAGAALVANHLHTGHHIRLLVRTIATLTRPSSK